jgi:hypothetical protein
LFVPPPAGIEGRTLRGWRYSDRTGVEVAGRHLFAVIDQHTRVVLGQVAVDVRVDVRVEGKGSEVDQFAPLLDTITDLDLAGGVITAAGAPAHLPVRVLSGLRDRPRGPFFPAELTAGWRLPCQTLPTGALQLAA